MANNKSQEKRNRQNEKAREKNTRVRSSIRTSAKKILKAVESKGEKDPAVLNQLFKSFVKAIDTAAGKKIVKKTTAARKKARLAKRVNSAIQA